MKVIQRIIYFPLARYHWAAAGDARRAEQWLELARHIEAMHAYYWKSDESRFLLGSAYAKLGRFGEAAQLLHADTPLRKTVCEQERRLNLALTLHHTGRTAEALELLPPNDLAAVFPDYAESALELREAILTGERWLTGR